MRRKIISLFLVCVLMAALSAAAYAAPSGSVKYDAIRVGIPVSGTGTFHMHVDDSRYDEDSAHMRTAAQLAIIDEEQTVILKTNTAGLFYAEVEEPGDYYYTIYSHDEWNPTVYDVHIYVTTITENGEESLFASITIFPQTKTPAEGEKADKVLCAYFPLLAINPPIRKSVTGAGAPADAEFKFEFRAVSTSVDLIRGDMPMPSGSDGQVKYLTAKGGEEVEAGNIWISLPGTYTYELLEVDNGLPGFTYDKSKYLIIFDIVETEYGLDARKTVRKDNSGYSGDYMDFVNTYGPTPTPTPVPTPTPTPTVPPTAPPGTPGTPGTPKTGDSSNLMLWALLCAGAGVAGVSVAIAAAKKKPEI